MTDTKASNACYLRGLWSKVDYQACFLYGGYFTTSDIACYCDGAYFYRVELPCYLQGATEVKTSIPLYMYGGDTATSSIPFFMPTTGGQVRGSTRFFISGIQRSSLSCYTEGLMTEYAYIILKTSNESINAKFRVISQGYDDGSLEKAENLERTIGGGISHSQGAVYTIWNPIIRVRETEDVSGYGSISDLRTIYELNNPNGTPSNLITFIDHHGTQHIVMTNGSFKKAMMGCKIEGNQAWFTVGLRFIKVG